MIFYLKIFEIFLFISSSRLDEAKKYRQLDRETINKLNQQIADLESECNMLRRSMESLETERQRDKTTINRLQQEVDKLRIVSSIRLFLSPSSSQMTWVKARLKSCLLNNMFKFCLRYIFVLP